MLWIQKGLITNWELRGSAHNKINKKGFIWEMTNKWYRTLCRGEKTLQKRQDLSCALKQKRSHTNGKVTELEQKDQLGCNTDVIL